MSIDGKEPAPGIQRYRALISRRRRWRAWVWLGLFFALSPRISWAEPPGSSSDPTAEDKETARNLYRLGNERFDAGDYHGAFEAFQAADRIMGVPTTGLGLGRTQAKLGLLVEARDRLLAVARYPREPNEPEPYTRARQNAAELAAELAHRIPAIRVEIVGPRGSMTEARATELKIDGRAIPPELRRIAHSLNPGSHTVEAAAEGFTPLRETVRLAEGDQRVVQLALTPLPAAVPPDSDSSDSGASGSEPLEPVMWAAFGIGAAGVLVGTITGSLTLSAESSLEEDCPHQVCPPDRQDDLDDASTLGHVSTVSFIVGGAGLLTGVVLLLVFEPGANDPVPAVQARVGPGYVGLTAAF